MGKISFLSRVMFVCIAIFTFLLPFHSACASFYKTSDPDISEYMASISSDWRCVRRKSDNACFYCGSSSLCSASCSSVTSIALGGKYTLGGMVSVGCLGSGLCFAPGNGIVTYEDGITTNTTFKFYTHMDVSTSCRRDLNPSICNTWATTATNPYTEEFNIPMCKCTTVASSFLTCQICNPNYHTPGEKTCSPCPCMNDIYGTERCGTSPLGTNSITGCRISPDYKFGDSVGQYNFTSECQYSE